MLLGTEREVRHKQVCSRVDAGGILKLLRNLPRHGIEPRVFGFELIIMIIIITIKIITMTVIIIITIIVIIIITIMIIIITIIIITIIINIII